eukprot:3375637-Prymnesium_polylepis.2
MSAIAATQASSTTSSEDHYNELNELENGQPSEPQPQAAVMPDGTLVMLSPENPYRDAIASNPPPEPEAQPSEAAVHATIALLRPALQLERMARLVRTHPSPH